MLFKKQNHRDSKKSVFAKGVHERDRIEWVKNRIFYSDEILLGNTVMMDI